MACDCRKPEPGMIPPHRGLRHADRPRPLLDDPATSSTISRQVRCARCRTVPPRIPATRPNGDSPRPASRITDRPTWRPRLVTSSSPTVPKARRGTAPHEPRFDRALQPARRRRNLNEATGQRPVLLNRPDRRDPAGAARGQRDQGRGPARLPPGQERRGTGTETQAGDRLRVHGHDRSAPPVTADGDLLDVDATVPLSLSGTYIRALARDLGQELGTGGHLVRLRRTRVGGYGLGTAQTLEQLAERFEVMPLAPGRRGGVPAPGPVRRRGPQARSRRPPSPAAPRKPPESRPRPTPPDGTLVALLHRTARPGAPAGGLRRRLRLGWSPPTKR